MLYYFEKDKYSTETHKKRFLKCLEKVKKHVHKSGIWIYCFYWCFYFRFSVWKNTLLRIPGTSVLAER